MILYGYCIDEKNFFLLKENKIKVTEFIKRIMLKFINSDEKLVLNMSFDLDKNMPRRTIQFKTIDQKYILEKYRQKSKLCYKEDKIVINTLIENEMKYQNLVENEKIGNYSTKIKNALKYCQNYKRQFLEEALTIEEGIKEYNAVVEGLKNGRIKPDDIFFYGFSFRNEEVKYMKKKSSIFNYDFGLTEQKTYKVNLRGEI